MNKILSLLLILFVTTSLLHAQIDIADARNMSEGSTVTVEGIVTNGPELSIIRYLQDATGAIAAYPGEGSVGDFPNDVKRGDMIQVTGELKTFNGLLEIDPISAYNVISNGNPLPDPLIATPDEINEDTESKLMTINGVSFQNGGSLFSVGNYTFSANGETSEIYVRSNHPLIGSMIPLATVNLTGICSEFNGLYQLLPRDSDDLLVADLFYITESPKQSNLTTDGFAVSWTTNIEGSSNIRYGTTEDMPNEINMVNNTTNHTIALTGLEPAEFYYVQVFSENGPTVVNSTVKLFSTKSNSSGTTQVYFNYAVDGNQTNGSHPNGITSAAMEAAIIERINAATSSIDVCAYNNNRPTIVAALTEAYNNGIVVRYIADDQTENSALQDPTPPFFVLKGNPGDPLMHNKFIVFDADSENDSWVMSGSTNLTTQNLATDFNNMIFIQDKALAKAYTLEFEEMWGSSNPTPGVFTVKFGEDKADNTPHLFDVNGMIVESYFSPSDNTGIAIGNALSTANDDLNFALLSFTNNELGNTVLSAHNNNVTVRGLIENINDQGSEFGYLQNNGVDVLNHGDNNSIHHKYGIVDAKTPGSDPIVITGSHNWTASADTRNDENTLIMHDPNIANIFLQEFEARWCEASGGANCTFTSIETVDQITGFEASIFPNPAQTFTNIKINLEKQNDVTISLWDVNGRLIHSRVLRNVKGTQVEQLQLNGLANGNYLLSFKIGNQLITRSIGKNE